MISMTKTETSLTCDITGCVDVIPSSLEGTILELCKGNSGLEVIDKVQMECLFSEYKSTIATILIIHYTKYLDFGNPI